MSDIRLVVIFTAKNNFNQFRLSSVAFDHKMEPVVGFGTYISPYKYLASPEANQPD